MEDSCLKTEVHVHVHDQRITSGKLLFCNHFCIITSPSSDKSSPVVEHVFNEMRRSDQHQYTSKEVPLVDRLFYLVYYCSLTIFFPGHILL